MPRERKGRGQKQAEKRRLEREETERKYLAAQERDVLFYDRPKNPFGLLTHEDERFFSEVNEEFKKNQWDDEDAKEAFIQNVFAEMKGKELKIATSPVSKFFESLLPLCPRDELQRIMSVFKGHTRELAIHRFGSFALEKISGHAGFWISKELDGTVEVETNVDDSEPLQKLFEGMVEELIYPEMHELFRDPFAHHTYQAFLNTLTGHPERNLNESAHNKKRKRHADKVVSVTTPESFTELHKRLLETLKGYEWSILENLVFDKYASPLLQSIIETDVPMKPKKKAKSKSGNKTLVEILLTGAGDPTERQAFITRLLQDTIGSRLMDVIIRMAPEETVHQLFTDIFKPKIVELSSDHISTFCTQRIIERLTNPDDVEFVAKTLLPFTPEFIMSSQISILTAVLDACTRTNTYCKDAREWVLEKIWVMPNTLEDLWTTLMELDQHATSQKPEKQQQTDDDTNKHTTSGVYPVSRFGALLAASLIRLPEDEDHRAIDDFTKLETSKVLFYMTHPFTSHVVEAMLSSKIPAPLRRKIINHIIGSVVKLATDPAGSHIIDACWGATTDLKYQRDKIAGEMAGQADIVRNDFFGKQVWRNWNMNTYTTNRNDWRRPIGTQETQYAKMPTVKKKPRLQKLNSEERQHKKSKKSYEGKPGIVTKHFSAVSG